MASRYRALTKNCTQGVLVGSRHTDISTPQSAALRLSLHRVLLIPRPTNDILYTTSDLYSAVFKRMNLLVYLTVTVTTKLPHVSNRQRFILAQPRRCLVLNHNILNINPSHYFLLASSTAINQRSARDQAQGLRSRTSVW